MGRVLQIEMKSSLFDPHSSDRRVLVRRASEGREGRPLYRVFLYLEGRDLPFVENVTYFLHPTFPDHVRIVPRTPGNPVCKLEIWTWGFFDIKATVVDKTGARQLLSHYLEYKEEISEGVVSFVTA